MNRIAIYEWDGLLGERKYRYTVVTDCSIDTFKRIFKEIAYKYEQVLDGLDGEIDLFEYVETYIDSNTSDGVYKERDTGERYHISFELEHGLMYEYDSNELFEV